MGGHASVEIRVPPTGDLIGDLVLRGEWELPRASALALELVEPGRTVLDLGAHLGTFALAAAARRCPVVAVEASARNVAMLEESARANGFEPFHIVHAAVGDRNGRARFGHRGPHGQVAHAWQADTAEVPMRRVDDLVFELGISDIALIKLDVEGSEPAAVAGMDAVLGRDQAPTVLYESNAHTLRAFGAEPRDLVASFEELGYAVYIVDERRHDLVLVDRETTQPETCIDCLAAKRPLPFPTPWRVRIPRTETELARAAVAETRATNFALRAGIATTLAGAPAELLERLDVRRALEALAIDPVDDVVRAASWWRGADHRPPRPPVTFGHTSADHALLARQLRSLSEQGVALRDRVTCIKRRWR